MQASSKIKFAVAGLQKITVYGRILVSLRYRDPVSSRQIVTVSPENAPFKGASWWQANCCECVSEWYKTGGALYKVHPVCVSLEGASSLVLRRRWNDKQGQVGVRQSEQKQEDKKKQNQASPSLPSKLTPCPPPPRSKLASPPPGECKAGAHRRFVLTALATTTTTTTSSLPAI